MSLVQILLSCLKMALIHLNNCKRWLLYLLCIGFVLALSLAKTSISTTKALSEDTLNLENNNLEKEQDSGGTLHNLTNNKARSLKCVPMIKYFEIRLTDILRPGEGVGLTGDHIKLGEWQINKSLEMKRRRRNPLTWYSKIPMCSVLRIYYRFFIYYKDAHGFKRLRYWESQQHARVLEAYEMYRIQGPHTFGHAHPLAVGGGIQQERGWLRKEYIIEFKFIWPQHISFTEFSHFIREPKYILTLKALPEDKHKINNKNIDWQDDVEIQVSRFEDKHSKLKTLTEQGVPYQPGDTVVFHITAADCLEISYVLGINTRVQEMLGEVVIPFQAIKLSEGILELPIFDVKQHHRVGWLTLPFLRIQALPQALKFNMRASFHHYWPLNWPTLDIGHRGLGKSFHYHSANALENTIDSFLKAKDVKSDMILLNVQLTKDYVPVVWHDFGFFTASSHKDKKLKRKDLSFVHIHDLTYQELLKKRIFMFRKGTFVEMTHYNTIFRQDKELVFPKLAQVYQQLPATLGIIIDIKWPQLLGTGTFESLQSLDKNRYVDKVVKTSLEFGCGRPLILASFDADICTMLRFKQHMFSVVFFSAGLHSPWETFADLRTHSLSNALRFVQASDILGTAIYAKEITPVQNNQDLNMAFELQQVLFVWGEQLNDSSLQDHFRNEELAGLIYDQIDTLMSQKLKRKRKRFAFFEAQELQRIFLRQCIAAGNLSTSEGPPDTHSPFWPRFRSLDEL